MIVQNLLKRLHLNSFRTLLVVIVILLMVLGLGGILWETNLTTRATLGEQVGITFAAQARGLSDLIGAFFLEKISQMQSLALSNTIKKSLIERNLGYPSSPAQIQAELETLDAYWLAASDDDPLIKSITTADEAVNPAASQIMDYVEAFPNHAEIFVTDRFGGLVAASNRTSDYYQADEPWWQAAWNEGRGAVFISDPIFDESTGVTAMQVAVPVRDVETGSVIGIVRSSLIVDEMFDLVGSIQIGQTGHAVLLNREGEVLFDPWANQTEIGSAGLAAETRRHLVTKDSHYMITGDERQGLSIFGHSLIHVHHSRENLPTGGDSHNSTGSDHRHSGGETGHMGAPETQVAAEGEFENQIAAAVTNLGWAAVVRQETDEAYLIIDQTIRNVSLIGLGVISLMTLSLVVLTRSLTYPLLQLNRAAQEIGAGRLNATLPSSSLAEIGLLSDSFDTMRQRLQVSFAQLEEETRRLSLVTVISEQLSAVLNLEELLTQVVNQVNNNFNYYHTHIYLIDDEREYLVLAEGTGPAGAEMKAKGHRIAISTLTSLVAQAARSQKIVSVANVREEPHWLPNELLPDTCAEIAVPIVVEGQVVGVLDVQQNTIGGLQEQDASLLRSVANQVAVAIRNARLFAEVETALAEARAAHRRYLEEAWQESKAASTDSHKHYYMSPTVSAVDEAELDWAKQSALEQDRPVILTASSNAGGTGHQSLVAPITLQDQKIGTVLLHSPSGTQSWAEDDLAIVEAVVIQIAQTAENLRLFDETRQKANQEKEIRAVTEQMRSAVNLEQLVKIAANALGEYFSADHALVNLNLGASTQGVEPENGHRIRAKD